MTTRIFFATDIHGSELCFKKFVAAARFYSTNVLILGGDITGKLMIPIAKAGPDSFNSQLRGQLYTLRGPVELRRYQERLQNLGLYYYIADQSELTSLQSDPERVAELFRSAMIERLGRWLSYAEHKLADQGVQCYIMPGNDDDYCIDRVLESGTVVQNPDGRVIRIDDTHDVFFCGLGNPSPFRTYRERTEDELAALLEQQVAHISDFQRSIFCIHVPPYASGLDLCPVLDKDLHYVKKAGQILMAPAGSVAVRQLIERYQPLLGLHGHIHESRGYSRIGRTLCVNPGSSYTDGILNGCLITLSTPDSVDFQLTAG